MEFKGARLGSEMGVAPGAECVRIRVEPDRDRDRDRANRSCLKDALHHRNILLLKELQLFHTSERERVAAWRFVGLRVSGGEGGKVRNEPESGGSGGIARIARIVR